MVEPPEAVVQVVVVQEQITTQQQLLVQPILEVAVEVAVFLVLTEALAATAVPES